MALSAYIIPAWVDDDRHLWYYKPLRGRESDPQKISVIKYVQMQLSTIQSIMMRMLTQMTNDVEQICNFNVLYILLYITLKQHNPNLKTAVIECEHLVALINTNRAQKYELDMRVVMFENHYGVTISQSGTV